MGWPSLSDVTRAVSNTYNGARDAVAGGAEAVRSTVVSGATAVRDTAVRAASTAADIGSAARDRAGDLARAGLDAGRRGVEAVRNIDVREAAATVRQGIGDATEAAREGISTGTSWASERVGDAADWSRSHVDGDGLASQVVRGAITTVESSTRFQLGVTGGLAREVVGTVGAAGQLATIGVEMQVSAEARVEYGQAIVDGVAGAADATGGYLQSVANDPGRLLGDAGGALDAAGGFVSDTASRYGQAIAEGRTEEIGMDVGTVASYVVPVGGGPVRGALTAAVREGGEAAARGVVTTLAREGGEAVVREGSEVAVRGSAEGATRTAATRATREGGEATVRTGTELAATSRETGRELVLYRDGATGARNVAGATDGAAPVAAARTGDGVIHLDPVVVEARGTARTDAVATEAAVHGPGNVPARSIDDLMVEAAATPEVAVPRGVPMSQAEFDRIRGLPAELRPADPGSYLPADYIASHLARFDDGGAYLVPTDVLDRFGREMLGRPDGVFVMPRAEMDALIARTGGDIARIETDLGIEAGTWSGEGRTLSRIDVTGPRDLDLRMPNGRETGANEHWMPGGKLPGGGSEAVVDRIPNGAFVETQVMKQP